MLHNQGFWHFKKIPLFWFSLYSQSNNGTKQKAHVKSVHTPSLTYPKIYTDTDYLNCSFIHPLSEKLINLKFWHPDR